MLATGKTVTSEIQETSTIFLVFVKGVSFQSKVFCESIRGLYWLVIPRALRPREHRSICWANSIFSEIETCVGFWKQNIIPRQMFNPRWNGELFRKQCSAAKCILVFGAFIYVTNAAWPNKMSLSNLSFTPQFVLYSFVVLDCRVENPLCRFWSAMGKCKKKATWMKKHCCATCKQVVNTTVNIQTCKYMCSAVSPSLCVV